MFKWYVTKIKRAAVSGKKEVNYKDLKIGY
jgi:hypothetical protein